MAFPLVAWAALEEAYLGEAYLLVEGVVASYLESFLGEAVAEVAYLMGKDQVMAYQDCC